MAKTPQTTRLPLRENSAGSGLMLTTLALLAMGVVMVHSATASLAQGGAWYARVEMRQLGPRDEAKLIGGCGRCGRGLRLERPAEPARTAG